MMNYLSFEGRCGRTEFAKLLVTLWIINSLLSFVLDYVSAFSTGILKHIGIGIVGVLIVFASWASVANMVKRLHDCNWSGWLALIPVFITGLAFCAEFFPQVFVSWRIIIKACGMIINMLFVIGIWLMPGSKFENKYGPVPE